MPTKCIVDGCEKDAIKKQWCSPHYQKYYKTAPDYRPAKGLRNSPLYMIWFERKQNKVLCEAWLNFETFIKDVSPQPWGNYFLVRIKDGPFGPDNFKWQEHLKRKDGESKRDWWARKRAARIAANPSMEADRNIKRKYGISREQYNEKLKLQNGVCAICGDKEKSVEPRNGSLKCLAVDHCHKTGKIRGLLCWRCNGTLGKIDEDIELLKKIELYLIKHKDN